jgi:YidC/Oxa1 family membrane protein insertase
MDKINEKFKDDPQRKQQEIFKLYREHGINPFGMLKGCAWMLIQIPIFFALYKLLYSNIDLRGAEFLWVRDLTQPDRLFMLPIQLPLLGDALNLLPLLTGATQMLASKFTTTPPTDEQQAQMQRMMIYMMPFMILIFTYGFPAGLMLYWLVSNMWQVLQQYWVNKHMRPGLQPPAPPAPAKAKA